MISADFERYKNTDYFPSAPHDKNSVSSRGWRSAPRDLTPAQALARYNRRVLRFRRDGPWCDLIAAGAPSPSARLRMTRIHGAERFEYLLRHDANYSRHPIDVPLRA